MKKNRLAVLVAAAAVTFAGYNMYQVETVETMSDIMLANVEALASGESSSDCNTYCQPDYRYTCYISWGSGIDGVTCPGYRAK